MRNRKVSHPVPVRPAAPKNVRVASKRSAAFNRLTLWFIVAIFGCSATAATIYGRLFLVDIRFEPMIVTVAVTTLVGAFALGEAFHVWREICGATERLGRRDRALAEIRRPR